MSLFADYYREREGRLTHEEEDGFLTWVVNGAELYIVDIYVKPEKRKTGLAARMADLVCEKAKEEFSVTHVTGSVDPRTEQATASMKVLLAWGMSVHSIQGPLIFFIKEIK
jgi:hypothetical protein